MSLFLIGDIHGHIDEYLKLLASLPAGSRSIALGDMYLGRPGVHLPELPPEHKFIRGNHDDPKLCREHPNYLGDFGYLPDDELFFVSGAQTASWRVLGNSKYWYADEELSESDLNTAIAIYKETRPKLVISHTAPSGGAREILKDLNGSYFLSKQIDLESRTSRALQEMFEAHQPSAWCFGHFHINREFLIGETKFHCLAEMAAFEVVSCDSSAFGIISAASEDSCDQALPESGKKVTEPGCRLSRALRHTLRQA
jgi:calcineurin-like phosphoesterase family protein